MESGYGLQLLCKNHIEYSLEKSTNTDNKAL